MLTPSVTDSFISTPRFVMAMADSPDSCRKHDVEVFVDTKLKFDFVVCSIPNVVIIFLVNCVFTLLTFIDLFHNHLIKTRLYCCFWKSSTKVKK